MGKNRHKNKNSNNHPKPKKTLIDGSSYSPNSIGGRIDLSALRDKLFASTENQTTTNQTITTTNVAENSSKSLQGEGKA
jgi:hypothetical protein